MQIKKLNDIEASRYYEGGGGGGSRGYLTHILHSRL